MLILVVNHLPSVCLENSESTIVQADSEIFTILADVDCTTLVIFRKLLPVCIKFNLFSFVIQIKVDSLDQLMLDGVPNLDLTIVGAGGIPLNVGEDSKTPGLIRPVVPWCKVSIDQNLSLTSVALRGLKIYWQ